MTPRGRTIPDRIAHPWGERTPYGPGDTRPVRVDTHLAEGVGETDVDRWVQTASILHSNGDGLDIAVKDGRICGVRGRADDRVNHGRLGIKDLYGWQANFSPDRLTMPLVRENGVLVETDWDTAMDRVVGRTTELLDEQGPSAIGFYTSGQLFAEEYYTLGVIAHGGIRTNHVDGNTRLCTATAAAALKASFGCDGQPGSYADIDHADVICLFGHNMAETQSVTWMRILDRLAGDDPPRILCVDPRPTPVVEHATIHLAPRPGTNLALMNGLIHELLAAALIDRAYVDRHTVGYESLAEQVADYPPERVAEICDVPAEQIREAARLLGGAERLMSTVLQGFYQSNQATAASVQVNNIHLLRGMLGRPGRGVLQMNGQPTAENTRECGADGDLAAFRNWSNPSHIDDPSPGVERRPDGHPALLGAHPRHADDALRGGRIDTPVVGERHQSGRLTARTRAHSGNPVAGPTQFGRPGPLPHRDRAARRRRPARGHLGREDRDLHQHRPDGAPVGEGRRPTRSGPGRPGHLPRLRPASGAERQGRRTADQMERPGVGVRGMETLHPRAPVRLHRAELRQAARRLGNPVAVQRRRTRWHRAPVLRWQVLGGPRLLRELRPGPDYRRAQGRHGVHGRQSGGQGDAQGGGVRPRTRTTRRPVPAAADHGPDHLPLSHPDQNRAGARTAGRGTGGVGRDLRRGRRRRGVTEGDLAEIATPRGRVEATVRLTRIRPGVVFLPFHYGYWDTPGQSGPDGDTPGRAVNELTATDWDPVSKQPLFKTAAAQIRRVADRDESGRAATPTTAAATAGDRT